VRLKQKIHEKVSAWSKYP